MINSQVSPDNAADDISKSKETDSIKSLRNTLSKQSLEDSFNSTIEIARKSLPKSSQLISKIIHIPYVEAFSELLRNSLIRPVPMLSGAILAFIIPTLFYVNAKNLGYELSGFETIGSFLIGWLIGLVIDLVHYLLHKDNE